MDNKNLHGDTEQGCLCKEDGEGGYNLFRTKRWCSIQDPNGSCVRASRSRCMDYDWDEDECFGGYWDYRHQLPGSVSEGSDVESEGSDDESEGSEDNIFEIEGSDSKPEDERKRHYDSKDGLLPKDAPRKRVKIADDLPAKSSRWKFGGKQHPLSNLLTDILGNGWKDYQGILLSSEKEELFIINQSGYYPYFCFEDCDGLKEEMKSRGILLQIPKLPSDVEHQLNLIKSRPNPHFSGTKNPNSKKGVRKARHDVRQEMARKYSGKKGTPPKRLYKCKKGAPDPTRCPEFRSRAHKLYGYPCFHEGKCFREDPHDEYAWIQPTEKKNRCPSDKRKRCYNWEVDDLEKGGCIDLKDTCLDSRQLYLKHNKDKLPALCGNTPTHKGMLC